MADDNDSDPDIELQRIELQLKFKREEFELEQKKLAVLARKKKQARGTLRAAATYEGGRTPGSAQEDGDTSEQSHTAYPSTEQVKQETFEEEPQIPRREEFRKSRGLPVYLDLTTPPQSPSLRATATPAAHGSTGDSREHSLNDALATSEQIKQEGDEQIKEEDNTRQDHRSPRANPEPDFVDLMTPSPPPPDAIQRPRLKRERSETPDQSREAEDMLAPPSDIILQQSPAAGRTPQTDPSEADLTPAVERPTKRRTLRSATRGLRGGEMEGGVSSDRHDSHSEDDTIGVTTGGFADAIDETAQDKANMVETAEERGIGPHGDLAAEEAIHEDKGTEAATQTADGNARPKAKAKTKRGSKRSTTASKAKGRRHKAFAAVRPEVPNAWYNVTEEEWNAKDERRKWDVAKMHFLETDGGMDAPSPCYRCRKHGWNCRIYRPGIKGSHSNRKSRQCSRCLKGHECIWPENEST